MNRLSVPCLVALALAGPCLAQDGLLDPGFGIFGTGRNVIAHDLGGGNADTLADVLVDGQDRIYLVATAHDVNDARWLAITRLDRNGILDASFGSGGHIFSTANTLAVRRARLDAAGNIHVAATRRIGTSNDTDFYVCRYTAQGQSLPFAAIGSTCRSVPFDLGGDLADEANDLLVDAQGRIVLVGTAAMSTTSSHGALARLLPDGSLDPTFGTGGKATFNLAGNAITRFNAIAPLDDGRYVVVGEFGSDEGVDGTATLFARVTTGGGLDSTFQSGSGYGGFNIDFGAPSHRDDAALAVARLPGGDLLVAGNAEVTAGGGRHSAFAYRVRPAAFLSIDLTFGNGGRARIDGGHDLQMSRAFVQSDGSILLVGTHQATPTFALDLAAMRLKPDGTLDATFGSGGRTDLDFVLPGELDFGLGIGLQGGRPVVAGSALRTGPQNFDLIVARLANDGLFASGLE